MKFISVIALAFGGVAVWGLSGLPTHGATLEELQACAEANIPEKSSAVSIELGTIYRGGHTSLEAGKVFWQRGTPDWFTMVCLSKPRDVKGLAYLIRRGDSEPAIWGFLPEEDRVSQPMDEVA